MAYNLFKSRELLFKRLNVDGSPLANPTEDDVLLLDYPQSLRFARVFEDAVVVKNEGPTGTICQVTKAAKLVGATAGLQIAKLPAKLAYFLEGGTYDNATDVHTPPMYDDAAPNPFSVEAFIPHYTDGKHDIADIEGYLKLRLPKCTGTFDEMTVDNANFGNPNVTITSEEYVDVAVPANSEPCYAFTKETVLPSADDYAVTFAVEDSVGAVDGAVVSVTVAGTPVTDTTDAQGAAELQLPLGTHTYTITKSGYTTGTGSVTVTLLGAAVEVTLVTG